MSDNAPRLVGLAALVESMADLKPGDIPGDVLPDGTVLMFSKDGKFCGLAFPPIAVTYQFWRNRKEAPGV